MSASDPVYDPLPDTPSSQPNHPTGGDGTRGLRLLVVLLAVLVVILAGPYLLSRFRYADTRARMQAEVDVASTQLTKVRAELSDLVTASRLVAKRVSPSVVSIHRADIQGVEGQGSGVIVDPEGYIITNYHVLEGATGLHVILADGRVETEPVVVGGDMRIDLALLKINKPDLIAAEWGDSDSLQVGDLVWAVGSPFGLDHTVTFGIVSAKQRRTLSQRSLQGLQSTPFQEFLQTDVAVNPGNSGGPLVDLDGNVVGINTAIVGQVYQGISLAIPSNLVKDTYTRLKSDGWVERGYLGVSPKPLGDRLRRRLDLREGEGVLAATVSPYTPAERAGLRGGDVILKWNEHNASDPFLLTQAIADTPVGSKARLIICRLVRSQPKELELEVTVGAAPRLERLAQ
ncbi:S1C family serine protease [Aeoliella sp.]|uniref:S1C family serine protease n=1 Tax=Aeoliella sp. TaxID=2795800 RepID=UPI003CCC187D